METGQLGPKTTRTSYQFVQYWVRVIFDCFQLKVKCVCWAITIYPSARHDVPFNH